MRLIVNKKQYNKILKHQQEKNKLFEGIVNFIYNNIIIYEKKLITKNNISKNNISRILKNISLDSIVIDMFRGDLMEINIRHKNNIMELDVILPKNINHTNLKSEILLEIQKTKLLVEQEDLYGLNFDELPLGDVITINYLTDRIKKSLNYDEQELKNKLLFIDGNNTFNNGGILNIDVSKFSVDELSTIIKELEKTNNTNYVLTVDKNGEEIEGIVIDFDSHVALSKSSDNKKVKDDDGVEDKEDNKKDDDKSEDKDKEEDDFEEVELDEVPDGSFTSAIPVPLHPVMYLISDVESGHNYNIQGG